MLFSKPKIIKRKCRHHGTTDFVLDISGYYRCKKCRVHHVKNNRKNRKKRFIELSGGKCCVCGYKRCMRALQFHHVDSSTKKFGISGRGLSKSFKEAKKEVDKCKLLCANCHAEVEDGLIDLNKFLKKT